ncbi:hypothetical protein K439DRAFT_1622794 [Ramaria rubella]|nr:hypothetical protein K439DRAFT_1622794 [Ramaria rubella]
MSFQNLCSLHIQLAASTISQPTAIFYHSVDKVQLVTIVAPQLKNFQHDEHRFISGKNNGNVNRVVQKIKFETFNEDNFLINRSAALHGLSAPQAQTVQPPQALQIHLAVSHVGAAQPEVLHRLLNKITSSHQRIEYRLLLLFGMMLATDCRGADTGSVTVDRSAASKTIGNPGSKVGFWPGLGIVNPMKTTDLQSQVGVPLGDTLLTFLEGMMPQPRS